MRIYRASSLGGCITAQVAQHLGFDPESVPQETQQYYEEGNLHEPAIINKLKEEGWVITDQQIELNLPLTPSILIQGHPDGLGAFETLYQGVELWVVEVKTMGDSTFKQVCNTGWDTPGLIQKYKWQTSCYMLATNRPLVLVYKNRNSGETRKMTADEPFYSKAEILTRVLEMESWVRRGQVPPCNGREQYPCQFTRFHEDDRQIIEGDTEEIESLARWYVNLQKVIKDQEKDLKENQGELAETRKKLKAACGNPAPSEESGAVRITAGKAKCTFWVQKNRPGLDQELAKADGVDLAKYYRQTSSERIRVEINDL